MRKKRFAHVFILVIIALTVGLLGAKYFNVDFRKMLDTNQLQQNTFTTTQSTNDWKNYEDPGLTWSLKHMSKSLGISLEPMSLDMEF